MSHENTAQPLILKRVLWPAADRAAWEALFTEGDIFDGAGPCCHWSHGSRTKREQSYGHWLGYCLTLGALDPLRDVTDRATEDNIRGFVDFELARCSPRTVQMHVEDLLVVFRAMSPDRDWKWLAQTVERLNANCNSAELKPRLGISATEIYAWAQARMRHIDRIGGTSELRRAAQFRDALMVGLLIAIPLRLRTFIAIELERHLNRRMSGFVLGFGPDDMKDRRSHEFVLPTELIEPMQQYLCYYRPKLLGGKSSSRLWITRHRKPFTYWGFQRQLPQLTLKEFGIALRPHAFRSIAATTIATDDPDHVNIIADVLRHSTLAMSEKHYNRANGVKAISDLQQIVQELRRAGKRREREMGRIAARRKAASRCSMGVRDSYAPGRNED